VDGIAQKPIEGVSMAYTFDAANANAPSMRKTQYFEMVATAGSITRAGTPTRSRRCRRGSRTRSSRTSTSTAGSSTTSAEDFSQADDLAGKMPDKAEGDAGAVREGGGKYNVFPLDNSQFSRAITPRPSATAGQTVFTYRGENGGIPTGNAPNILNKSFTITAEIEIPKAGAEGMIVTEGGRFGGYGLFLLKGKPVFVYNLLDLKRTAVGGRRRRTRLAGRFAQTGQAHDRIRLHLRRTRHRQGRNRRAESGRARPRHREARAHDPVPAASGRELRRGVDSRTPVDKSYQIPFRFTGTINRVTFKLGPTQLAG
jgi:arylsulfatase